MPARYLSADPAQARELAGTVEVYDPAMCCPTGLCGPGVDPALLTIARDLRWLDKQGVTVHRFGLAQEPDVRVHGVSRARSADDSGRERRNPMRAACRLARKLKGGLSQRHNVRRCYEIASLGDIRRGVQLVADGAGGAVAAAQRNARHASGHDGDVA